MADIDLQIVASLVDNASSALKQVGSNLGNMKTSLDDVKKSADKTAETFGLMSAAILAPIGLMVNGAMNEQASIDLLKNALESGKQSALDAAGGDSVLLDQKKLLVDKISANTQKIEDLTTKYDKGKLSTEAYTAQVDKLNQANEQLSGKLDLLKDHSDLAKTNIDQLTETFVKAAQQNTDLGFTMDESIKGYTQLFNITGSVVETEKLQQTAMDLARAKNEDLATAAKQVGLAYEGNGLALKQFGIFIKDGLTGMQAVEELQGKVANAATSYAESSKGQFEVLSAKLQDLGDELGTTLLPIINQLLQAVTPVVQQIMNWVQAHPKLTEGIMATVTGIGLLFAGIATIAGAISATISIVGGLSAAFTLLGTILTFLSANPIVLIIAAIALLIIAIYEIVTHWQQVRDMTIKVWTEIQNFLKPAFQWVEDAWAKTWQTISDFFTAIWNGISGTFNTMINNIKSGFQNMVNFVTNILQPIISAANSVGSFLSQSAKGVTSGLSSAVSSLASIHLASGGIVTQPTLALVGESGPEAVIPLGGSGFGGNMTININNGVFRDSESARQIANTIAKLINQQLKLRTF